ncbi:flagellar basal-body MS-ring/collar protein FliF [Novosphingobium sp. FSW06-99]|uniref:flagellar basal-body MS-ring/collar protein FliF n=1 Tax=Novosphingobium sp. FSW06-99 TaxID=1739113 RepID=UPI00076BEC45|nr:flagellar basal-body MS-ring/collar protein FliF [Novosphingobium sp. FSW06-99]KUR70960.1 flagellar M-ring protein FliF [Novosphingobium sp. FSW06-99]
MADLVPAGGEPGRSLLAPLTDAAGGSLPARLGQFVSQGPVRRALPWFAGVAAAGMAGLLWLEMAPAPQRMLYTDLNDSERAQVSAALDKAAIRYTIDNRTGAITVGEDDLYKARMLAAADGALATPETGEQMIDKLPLGASRTVEGQRLQAARERELELTIMQIEGVEAVRIHLAEPEKSAFVRDNAPPTASVMVKLAKGRQLSAGQVTAIINLVAGSVPGLTVDAIKVIDQQGHLLSSGQPGDSDRLEMEARLEDKLRDQVEALLTPMLGAGNFSSEIQVDLDMDQQTSARESYDKQGAVRTETQSASQTSAGSATAGVPGVLSNTPPPQPTPSPGAPTANSSSAAPAPSPTNTDSSSTKTYELGREVAVTNAGPGKIRRLSVAVALSAAAMAKAKPGEIDQIKQLVSATVGADTTRGDQIAVVVRNFQPTTIEQPKFWETPWFAMAVRNGVALLAVLLTLLLGVRPLIKALKREAVAPDDAGADADDTDEDGDAASPAAITDKSTAREPVDPEMLGKQVGLAQRLVREKPDTAVAALRQMLTDPETEPAR